MLKLTTDKHEASCGLSATAELLVLTWVEDTVYVEQKHDQSEMYKAYCFLTNVLLQCCLLL